MTGYVRTDTVNNIADGNVISAADLDGEFNAVQAGFNSSTGHTHDGTASEGAPITKLGPVQDVTISTTVLGVKTTNTVDLGTSSLKFKDFYLAGNASIGGTLGVTGATTLSAALTYGGVTLSNAVTGTGNMVLSASPTITGTITAAAANFSGAVALNGNATIGDADTDTITQAASYVTGTQLKSAKTATNTLALAAYDVDGTAYTNLITLTASNTPTLALTSTGVGTINNMSIGATTASTGAFTTLSTTGNITNSNSAGRLDFTGASSAQVWATASSLYLDASSGQSVIIRPNNQVTAATFSSTGLAVTGTGSFTNIVNITRTGTTNLQLESPTGGSGISFRLAGVDKWGFGRGIVDNSNTLQWYDNDAGSTRMSLTASGNLGITETNPTAKLQISVASAAVNGTKGVRITNPAGTIVMLECGSGGDSFVGTESGSTFNIRTNNAINATFLTSGNVGIGETNPTQILHLKGSSTTYALAETTGSGTSSGFRMKAGAGTDFTLYTTQGGNQFGIYNNTTSTQPLTIDASGNLIVGDTSSGRRFKTKFDSNTVYSAADFETTSLQCYIANASSTIGAYTGIQFAVGNNGDAAISAIRTADGESALTFGTRGGGSRLERVRIDSSGRLLVGQTSGSYKLSVTGTVYLDTRSSTGYGSSSETTLGVFGSSNEDAVNSGAVVNIEWKMYGNAGGQFWYANYLPRNGSRTLGAYCTGTSWTNSSDIANKENIEPIKYGLETVMASKPVDFDWKSMRDENGKGKKDVGFIAQDMELLVPEVVTGEEGQKGISYGNLVAVAFKAIQEQNQLITQLTARITALESA